MKNDKEYEVKIKKDISQQKQITYTAKDLLFSVNLYDTYGILGFKNMMTKHYILLVAVS